MRIIGPAVRRAAAPDPADDLVQLQRELRRMGGHGSADVRDARHAAQAQSLLAAHGSDDAQRARGTAAALAQIRSSGVSGGRTDAAEAEAQAGNAEQLAMFAKQDAQRGGRGPAAGSGTYDPYAEGPASRWRQAQGR